MRWLVPALFAVVVCCSSSEPSTSVSGASDTDDVQGDTDAGDPGDATDADAGDAGPLAPAPFPCGVLTTAWSRCVDAPVYQAGGATPDGLLELSTGDPSVMFDSDDGLWKMWWSTGVAASFAEGDGAPIDMKYGESTDGMHWSVQLAPVLRSGRGNGNWDDSQVETPSVIKVPTFPADRRFVMFFAGANNDTNPVAVSGFAWYQIGVAFSADGKAFTRLPASDSPYASADTGFEAVEGLVLLGRDAYPDLVDVEDGLVADPEVVFDGTTFHMYFSSLATKTDRSQFLAFGIAHATSTDAIHWTAVASNPVVVGGAQPTIVETESGYEMFYNQDTDDELLAVPSVFNPYLGIWRIESTDLATWTNQPAARDFVWDGTLATETYGLVKAGDMAYADGVYRYYYPGFSSIDPPDGFYAPIHDPDHVGELTFVPAVIGINLAGRLR